MGFCACLQMTELRLRLLGEFELGDRDGDSIPIPGRKADISGDNPGNFGCGLAVASSLDSFSVGPVSRT